MANNDPSVDILDRYRRIEYDGNSGAVTIIQDRENTQAWIQSDISYDVIE